MKSLLSFMTFSRLLRQIQCGVWKSAGKRPSNAVAIVLAKMLFANQQENLREYLKGRTKYPSKYPTRGDSAKRLAAYDGMQPEKASQLALEDEKLGQSHRRGYVENLPACL
ncbi:MAG: hypothetical protein DMG58_15495 [Acidobacteria bacterium]|nr:MAG: hypothetical protein DMG58_15495 [Acidobacteriota bacterium]